MTDNIIVFKKRHFSSFCTQCALFAPALCLFFSAGLIRNINLCLKGHRYMNTKSTILNTVLFYSQCLQLGSFSLPGFNWPFIPIDMEDFWKKASPENLQNRMKTTGEIYFLSFLQSWPKQAGTHWQFPCLCEFSYDIEAGMYI